MSERADDRQLDGGQTANPEAVLSSHEAASILGVTERAIRRVIASGALPATKRSGVYQISPEDVARYRALLQPSLSPDARSRPEPARVIPFPARERHATADPPRSLTSLIGREREIAAVSNLVQRDDVSLLTLTGTGGVGKTRLAQALGERLSEVFADGVWFVSLAPITDPALVVSSIAQVLGVRETGGEPLVARLKAFLREKHLLLVLDNFEHVVEAAPLVTELLAASSGLKVLVTSRVRLRISAEHEHVVPPLGLTEPEAETAVADPRAPESVRLFVERAQAVREDFALTAENADAVAQICRRLDGLPLAIELAAARIKILSPAMLLTRLERRLPLLIGGGRDLPARQRTMRDTIVWSYDLLTPAEQTLFRRLAIFGGGFTFEAAEAVCATDDDDALDVLEGVASLVDNNLLRQEPGPSGEPRYAMLETIREFGLDQVTASGEETSLRDAHLAWVVAYLERVSPAIHVLRTTDWLDRLEADHDNLRAALSWALERGDSEAALRLAGALRDFWYLRGHISEGHRWLEASLAIGADAPAAQRARVLLALGEFANDLRDPERGTAALHESLALYRALGDRLATSHALYLLGCQATDQGDYAAAEPLMAEARSHAEAMGDRFCGNAAVYQLGVIAQGQRDLDLAMARYQESQDRARAEDDCFNIANTLWYQGLVHCARGELARAADALEEALAMERALGSLEGAAPFFANLAVLAVAADRPEAAARLLSTATGVLERRGMAFDLPERVDYDQALADSRCRLGEDAFRAAWDSGVAQTIEGSAADVAEVLAAARAQPDSTTPPNPAEEIGLTSREMDVLRLVAQGHSNREIAEALFISVPTVKRHLTNVLAKLRLPSRSALNTYAHTRHLV